MAIYRVHTRADGKTMVTSRLVVGGTLLGQFVEADVQPGEWGKAAERLANQVGKTRKEWGLRQDHTS